MNLAVHFICGKTTQDRKKAMGRGKGEPVWRITLHIGIK